MNYKEHILHLKIYTFLRNCIIMRAFLDKKKASDFFPISHLLITVFGFNRFNGIVILICFVFLLIYLLCF